jgi:nitrogen fixation NifU-like protein
MESPDAVGKASLNDRPPYLVIYVRVSEEVVTEASFQTFGCGYSIASCSALTEMMKGRTVTECLSVSADELIKALDGMPEHKQFCAQLAIDAMRDAIGKLNDQAGEPEGR